MPFKITTLSFNKEGLLATSGFVLIKNLLLFITFLSMLAGLILIGAGSSIVSQPTSTGMLDLSRSIAVAAIIIGLLITIVSFFGCFGAANEKGVMLKTYFACLLILVILEISVGIAAGAKQNEIPELLRFGWKQFYDRNNTEEIQRVQSTFRCCGFSNVTDMSVPAANCTELLGFKESCFQTVTNNLQNSLGTIAGAGIALAIIEFLGIGFSAFLFNRLAKRQDANQGLLNETWRINQNRVQYGYQNYQYA